MPRWAQSIRFRLSLAYSLAVFVAGLILVAMLYVWQVRQLDHSIIVETQELVYEDPATGDLVRTRFQVLSRSAVNAAVMEALERQAYRRSIDQLRYASTAGLALLFFVAFGSGWLLSGWTLRPIRRMVAVARDVSGTELSSRIGLRGPDDELKDLADTFDEMLDRVQASVEDRRRFVQDASHELRNPLAVARTNLELVLDDPDADAEELRQAAGIALTSTGRIGHIVEELVDQARHGMKANPGAAVDLRVLAAEVAAEFEASAALRGLVISVRADGGGPEPVVKGDEAALRRALTNLVVNAVRLAPEHTTIEIAIDCQNDELTLAVTDSGPGIAAADQEAVFERFWRGNESGPGLGLGLSIVRRVAERHGGRAEVTSALGSGTTFTILLPIPVGRRREADGR